MNWYILLSSFQNSNKKTFLFLYLKKEKPTNQTKEISMMGKEAKGFNIDKENYTWSKEIKEELTLVWGQATQM